MGSTLKFCTPLEMLVSAIIRLRTSRHPSLVTRRKITILKGAVTHVYRCSGVISSITSLLYLACGYISSFIITNEKCDVTKVWIEIQPSLVEPNPRNPISRVRFRIANVSSCVSTTEQITAIYGFVDVTPSHQGI